MVILGTNAQNFNIMRQLLLLAFILIVSFSNAQSINDLIDKVDINGLTLTLNELTGEVPTTVNGNPATIINRTNGNNDTAADYLIERLSAFDNLTVVNQAYSAGGRNIIATQTGQTNPSNIYIICAHYDSVANYCADDNISGTAAVLEVARILSTQCIDNTIVYALWDEEEIGLRGSNYYATQAANNGDNILAVLNLDMMAYDGDNDNDFDIDVRNFAQSRAMKDEIISVLNTYGFNLNVNVVDPGTTASDHSSFWFQSPAFSAVLLGEAWSNNDQTPEYHTSDDRVITLDLPYYEEMTKLVTAYMTTKAGLVAIDNTVTINSNMLTANQAGATYQWINCNTDTDIAGAVNQTFAAPVNGNYAVRVTTGGCTEVSDCIQVSALGVDTLDPETVNVYPIPTEEELNIELPVFDKGKMQILNLAGRVLVEEDITENNFQWDVSGLSSGLYFIKFEVDGKTVVLNFITK